MKRSTIINLIVTAPIVLVGQSVTEAIIAKKHGYKYHKFNWRTMSREYVKDNAFDCAEVQEMLIANSTAWGVVGGIASSIVRKVVK